MKFYSKADFQKLGTLGLVPEPGTSAPSSPVDGQLWWDSTNKVLKEYNGGASTWVVYIKDGDSRLADSRPPNGAAGGDLTGSFPNPDIAAGVVGTAEIANALKPSAGAGTTVESLRRLGLSSSDYAMPGNTTLNQIVATNPVTADLDFANWKLVNVATPTSGGHAATKSYVDGVASGLSAKGSVRAATTGNITLSGTQTIDGVACIANDRVLAKAQSTGADNGIYVVAAGAWTRASDADTAAELRSAFTFVEEGTVNANTGWVQTTDSVTLGSTAMTWTQFSGAGAYTAGVGLGQSGTDFFVNVDGSSIEINSDTLRVKAGGVTNAMLAGFIDLTTKVTNALPVANGGTAATSADNARLNLLAITSNTVPNPALSASTWSSNINSGLTGTGGSVGLQVKIYDAATSEEVAIDWKVTGSATFQLRADMAVSSAALMCVCQG